MPSCSWSLMLQFNSWGILNTFGVFQTYYESDELFHQSSSAISWIGFIQSCMLLAVGFVAGPYYDRGYLRTLWLVGSFGVVFGHIMLSICNTYWQVLLAQGTQLKGAQSNSYGIASDIVHRTMRWTWSWMSVRCLCIGPAVILQHKNRPRNWTCLFKLFVRRRYLPNRLVPTN